MAPRAKLNQQRARRFRSAKEAQQELEKSLKKKHSGRGGETTTGSVEQVASTNQERFDSNCITPGIISSPIDREKD